MPLETTDYPASPSDHSVLRKPPREPLDQEEITKVFSYHGDMDSKYDIEEIIGAGSYGVVRRCIEKATGHQYAVKTLPKIPKKGPCNPRYLLKLRNEVDVMQQLGNSLNAVHLQDVFEEDEYIHLVMELCTGGPLLDRLVTRRHTEKYIAQLVRSMLQFIAQCHSKGIIYRDVKADNFLFLDETDESPLKATDFGLSIRHWPDEPNLHSRTGTPAYMAPELILQDYGEKSDIWSVGMLAYQLLTGHFPYWGDITSCSLKQLWNAIVNQDVDVDRKDLKRCLSKGARDFLKTILIRNPKLRPTALEALTHPWVVEGGIAPDNGLQGSVVQRLQRFATYGDLKQLVLKKVTDELRDEEGIASFRSELRELFDKLDVDRSGQLSYEEVSEGLRDSGYSLTDAEIQQLMAEVDIDCNGYVDFTEFMTTMIDWCEIQNNQSQWKPYLDHIFGDMDRDGDGFISLDEIVDYLPESNTKASRQAGVKDDRLSLAKRMLREADSNDDGKISREEFYEMMVKSVVADSLEQYDSRLYKTSSGENIT